MANRKPMQDIKRQYYLFKLGLTTSKRATDVLKKIYWKARLTGEIPRY